ncbi:hypothetical protein E2562_017338 [Oryza meyeriana var. granulata]|uniref:Uncharacterized protein n=1 Tax=Oryza meyeriana var. granulata TaxID=110450 RepID=A0A6G1BX81_9ORYZ|nr:hypothetical protein E2562_017338 [Oryza meyeriana var. granulata]
MPVTSLHVRLAALTGCADVTICYVLLGEGLGHLRDMADDGDLWGLVSLLFYYHEDTMAVASGGAYMTSVTKEMPRSASSAALAMPGGARDGEYGTAVRVKVNYGGEIVQLKPGLDGQASVSYYVGGVPRQGRTA